MRKRIVKSPKPGENQFIAQLKEIIRNARSVSSSVFIVPTHAMKHSSICSGTSQLNTLMYAPYHDNFTRFAIWFILVL
jgi:hypothetical protein